MKRFFAFLVIVVTSLAYAIGSGFVAAEGGVSTLPFSDSFDVRSTSFETDGGVKIEMMKEKPEIRIKKWDGEVDVSISYDKVYGKAKKLFFSDRVEWKDEKEEVHAYPIKAKTGLENGGFEIEVVLNEKPSTNRFDFSINGYQNLDFFYQASLDKERKDALKPNTDHCTETECFDKNGKLLNRRPESVIGSYAVYYSKKNYNPGGPNYGTGKVFHIYRPKAIDSQGKEQWAELYYSDGVLSVVVPQFFLDSATYPVIVDPTIGYNVAGASEDQQGSCINSYRFSASLNGNANPGTIYAYGRYTGSSQTFAAAAYASNGGTVLNQPRLSNEASLTMLNSSQWVNGPITWSNIALGTDYFLAIAGDGELGSFFLNYDTSAPGYNDGEYVCTGGGYSPHTTPTTWFGSNEGTVSWTGSVYVDYSLSNTNSHIQSRGGGTAVSSNPFVKIRGGTGVGGSSAFVQSAAVCSDSDNCPSGTPNSSISLSLSGVTAGSLIVAYIKWEGADTSVTVCDDGATCAAGHAFTLAAPSEVNHSNGDLNGAFYYLLSSQSSGSVTYTATLGASRPYIRLHVWEETYTGTASLNAANGAPGTTALSSGNVTTTGTGSWVAFGAYGEYDTSVLSARQVNGQSADQKRNPSSVVTPGTAVNSETWRKSFDSTFTGAATATGASNPNTGHIVVFNFSGTSVGGSVKFR